MAPAPEAAAPAATAGTAVPEGAEDPDEFEALDDLEGLDDLGLDVEEPEDELEHINRPVFEINDTADTYFLAPIAEVYSFVFPDGVKRAIRRAYRNLGAPKRLANDLLQGEFEDAAVTTSRFVLNTTVGGGGFFDPADQLGLEHHVSDFGQTMHAYGIEQGPYVVLPVFGPSTARDAIGSFVDGTFFDPLGFILPVEVATGVSAGDALTTRESLIDEIDDLKATSIDYYASVRSLYLQNRAIELERADPEE